MSCTDKSPEKSDKKPPDEASKTIPVLIDRTTSSSECPDVMNMKMSNKTVKNQSWASNYLQSIGLTYDKTIFKQKIKMSSSQDNSSNFLTQDSTVTIADVNLTNVNYNNVCNPSIASHGNDESFANYSNIAPTTEIQGTVPDLPYTNPYVNDNNSYYSNQAKGNVTNSEFPIIYYDPVTPNTFVDANLLTTYPNAFEHPMTNVTSNIYYNSNETSQLVNANLPITYSDTYYNQNNNYYGQKNYTNENDMRATATLCDNVNKTQITTADSNLQSLHSGNYDNPTHANSSTAFSISNLGNSQNMEMKTHRSNSPNINEKKSCNCLCTKLNQDKEQIKENENKNKKTIELEQECLSKVQENERKFRDFLKNLYIKRQPEQEKKQDKSEEKSIEDKSINKKRKQTDSQQANKTYPKLIKTKYADKQEPTRNKKRKEIEILPAKKTHIKFKERNYVDKQDHIMNKKSKVIEFRQDEKIGQLLKKTKCVAEQRPEVNRKKREVELKQDEKTRPKFIKTKYVDEQEPIYAPPKKPRIDNDYEIINYTNPEYKALNKVRIDSKYVKPKSETRICKSEKELLSRNDKRNESSFKVKKSKTESTKYHKYKPKDCDETIKPSPEKNIINTSKINIPENKDLRDILYRKLHKKESILINKGLEHEIPKKKSDVLNDNLVITVNNDISKIEKSPEKTSNKNKSKRETRKKINLVINILYKQPSSESESDKSDCDHSQANSDLSFLDEIDVDEIVESLSKSEKIGIHKKSITDESNTIPEGRVSVNETQIIDLIEKDNTEIDKAKMIIGNGDVLSNLFLKEAHLLDSLRLVHQEIETEKRVLKDENQLFEDGKPGIPMILQKAEDNTHSLVPVSTLLERIKKHGTKDTDKPCKEHPSTGHAKLSNIKACTPLTLCHSSEYIVHDKQIKNLLEIPNVLENNKEDKQEPIKETDENLNVTTLTLCHSGEDIVKDKQIKNLQEITNILENNIKDKQEPIKETDILGKDLNVTTIDLSNDDSNDSNKMDEITSKTIIHKEQTLDLVTKENLNIFITIPQMDTIDLTTDNNTDNSQNVLNYALKEIQTKTTFEQESNNLFAEKTIPVGETIINNMYTAVVNKGLQINGETLIESNKISGDNGIDNRGNMKTEIKNDTFITVVDTSILNEDNIETFATNTIKGRQQEINNENISNVQTTKPQSDIIVETSTSKPSTNDCCITQEKKEDINIITFETVALSDSKTVNHDSRKSKLDLNKKENDHVSILDFETGTSKTISKDCNTSHVIENNSDIKCEIVVNTNVEEVKNKEENDHKSLIIVNNGNANEVSENQNALPLSLKCVKLDETLSIMNTVNVSETLIGKAQEIVKNKDSDSHPIVEILDEKDETHINEISIGKTQVKDKNAKDCNPNPNIKVLESKDETQITRNEVIDNEIKNKSDSINTKVIPSPRITSNLINSPSASLKKDESNDKTVISSIKIGDDNKKINSTMSGMVAAIAARLERQMLKCFDEKFTVINLIHSGTFSKIFHCRNDKLGNDYAVKSLNSSTSVYKDREQIDILYNMARRNSSLVYLLNSFVLNGHLCLFTEYYPKNLKHALEENGKPFHINVVHHLARQLVSAVVSLKDQDIVHLDINPRHILLNHTNSQLKLCGFDEARKIHKVRLHYNLGTINYSPPELILGANPLGFGVDVWATGLVLYEMATNIQLFPGKTDNAVLFQQMCTLGALPIEMIYSSRFGHKHFTGSNFMRIMGPQKKINIITKFFRSGRLESTIGKAYNMYWRSKASKQGLASDVDKILFLTSLLKEMLQVDPIERINIQGVNAHPFIRPY